MTLPPNIPDPDNQPVPKPREGLPPEIAPTAPDAVAATSAATSMPVKFAARRQTWTVLAIVVVAILTLLAFGTLIWQALQPV
jgi:hypothetical protein